LGVGPPGELVDVGAGDGVPAWVGAGVRPGVGVGGGVAAMVKAAATVSLESMVTSQVEALPVHAPDQPPNSDPEADDSVSVTVDPCAKCTEHAVADGPQSIPIGLLETLPLPDPVRDTVKVSGVCRLIVALFVVSPDMTT
jgi:hypothetical protein